MAFAIAAWKSQIIPAEGPSRGRGVQRVEIDITQANTDTDADIGDLTGTLWTAAGSSTNGAPLKALLTALYPLASDVMWKSALFDSTHIRVAATPSGAQFTTAVNSTTKIPEFTFVSGSAPTAWTLVLEFSILEGNYPKTPESYGTI
jgi:hypothetical protein